MLVNFSLKAIYAFQVLSALITSSTPRAATHWKLQQQPNGQALVLPAEEDFAKVASEDPVLSILLAEKYGFGTDGTRNNENKDGGGTLMMIPYTVRTSNKSQYDDLQGIVDRLKHPFMPEPEVSLIFKRSESEEVNLDILEYNLRDAMQISPNSLSVLNQVGNFWRVKGSTSLAVECFRKALIINPHHPDVLLNLARVLFNLGYKEDALLLAGQSLDHKNSDQNTWLQHFTLGEIHQSLSRSEEAGHHFRHVLDLNPNFQPAERHLHQLGLGDSFSYNTTLYTLGIILALFLIVFLVLYLVTEGLSKSARPTGNGFLEKNKTPKGKRGISC
ncbi:hypothetical protein BSL78_20566 [Apostichopus japonicus]|uniref:Uncharacterized protein n=1 Tax=Stichopus japonicus TaxID=307972 RepID=A0A2G8K3J1_STIJA|nr:hypothetical protein BSL78_20566 [Apostichopus japonicus]